jgi:hypothetical protein
LVTTLAPEDQAQRAVTIFLPIETHQALRDLARDNERSLSAELRYIVKRYVDAPEDFGGPS